MRFRNAFVVVLSLAACVTGGLAPGAAAPSACTRFVLTGHPSYPPVSSAVPGGSLHGAGIAIVRALAQRAGVPIEVVDEGSWDAAQRAVRAGKADAIVGLYRTPAREPYFNYMQPPIGTDPTAVLVKKRGAFAYRDWNSLIGKRGVAAEGEQYGHRFDVFIEQKLTLRRVASPAAVYRALLDGSADYGLDGYYAALENAPRSEIAIAMPNVVTENLYLAFGKSSPCWAAAGPTFSSELTTMIASGAVKKIFDAALTTYGMR